jgi:hypothetical protein
VTQEMRWNNMATDARLTRIEKNDVIKLIERQHFSPVDFEWTTEESEENTGLSVGVYRKSILTHRPTGYYFVFGGRYLIFAPGETQRTDEERRPDDPYLRLRFVDEWLGRLRREYDAPDLWAAVGKENVLTEAASSETLDNRPFAPDELQLINTKLDDIKSYVLKGQTFDAEQGEFVEREFDYLKESSTRMGRKDWLNIFVGGLVGTIFTLGLDPEKARGLFALAGTAFQALWGITKALLQ